MAAEMQGGTSALGDAAAEAAPPQPAQPPLDLDFVAQSVEGGGWAHWGERFENLDDLQAKIASLLPPGRLIGRLALAAYSAEHTSGYMAFDSGFASRERIDGLNHTPIKPEVAGKLERLKPLLDADAVVELRVAGVGHGEHGRKALTALAQILGVPVRGPVDKAAELMPALGLIPRWLTVYPAARGGAAVESRWIERSGAATRDTHPVYVPVPGDEPPAALASDPTALVFATANAAGWAPGAEVVTGIADLVRKVITHVDADPIRRLAVVSVGSTLYDGFIAFDSAGGESIDGSIREQPEYTHLHVMYDHVRTELERLRPYLAHDAEVELRVARFGAGEAGRRALQTLHEVLGVTVRAPASSVAELRAAGGLATRWRTFGAQGLLEWRWTAEPAAGPVPLEAAAFAPIRGVSPPLGTRPEAAATVADAPQSPASSIPPGTDLSTLIVLCGGCGRILDEPPATPTRARMPCPACGSVARRRETAPPKAPKQSLRGRVRHLFG